MRLHALVLPDDQVAKSSFAKDAVALSEALVPRLLRWGELRPVRIPRPEWDQSADFQEDQNEEGEESSGSEADEADRPTPAVLREKHVRLRGEGGPAALRVRLEQRTLWGFDYDVRLFDGAEEVAPPSRVRVASDTHRPAAVHRYAPGQKLVVLHDGGAWRDATVESVGSGNRHVMSARGEIFKADLSSFSHAPAWLSAAAFEQRLAGYCQQLLNACGAAEPLLAGPAVDVMTLPVRLRLAQSEDEDAWPMLQEALLVSTATCVGIVGERRSGKSLLLRRLAATAIRGRASPSLPVLLSAAELGAEMEADPTLLGDLILRFVERRSLVAAQQRLLPPPLLLQQAMAARRCLFLIDDLCLPQPCRMAPRLEAYLTRLARAGHQVIYTASRAEGVAGNADSSAIGSAAPRPSGAAYPPTPAARPPPAAPKSSPQAPLFAGIPNFTAELLPLDLVSAKQLLTTLGLREEDARQLAVGAGAVAGGSPAMLELLAVTNRGVPYSGASQAYEAAISKSLSFADIEQCPGGLEAARKVLERVAFETHRQRSSSFAQVALRSFLGDEELRVWQAIRAAVARGQLPLLLKEHRPEGAEEDAWLRFAHRSLQ
ncbi:unnamed protein product, partial [Polarella glacialis]